MKVSEWEDYLRGKSEHYAISDEFIRKYQQSPANSNGYVYYAWEEGKVIHKNAAEPNQKWHFFEAYISTSLKDNKINGDDPAEKIYNRILCPELLLWLAEACCVDAEIVKKASKKAKEIIDSNVKFARNTAGREIKKIITWALLEEKISNESDI